MEPNQPTPEQQTEDQEWAAATEQFSADKGIDPAKPADEPEVEPKTPEKPAEPAKPEEAPAKTPEAPTPPPENETDEQKAEREAKEAEEAAKVEAAEDDPYVRSQRSVQRQIEADRKTVSAEVREQLFGDVKTELTDADGDVLKTPADVMKLINPNTEKPFTAEEATIYLFQAQKHLDQQLKEVDAKVERITEVNLDLKDQADNVRSEFGELLKANPEVAKNLNAEFKNTLKVDEKTGYILEAPVSLENFYRIALAPYQEMAAKMEADAAAEAKRQTQQSRKRTQTDRGDLIATGKTDTMDKEEAEWAEAAKAVYGK